MNNLFISVFSVITVTLICNGCSTTAPSEKGKQCCKEAPNAIISALKNTKRIELYQLTPIAFDNYFSYSDGKRFAPYPIKAGPLPFNGRVMSKVVSIICNPDNHDTKAKLGCGFPRWDYMLKIEYQNADAEILVWTRVSMIALIQGGKWIDNTYLGNAYHEFGQSWTELLKSTTKEGRRGQPEEVK